MAIKGRDGKLLGSAIPKVAIAKDANYWDEDGVVSREFSIKRRSSTSPHAGLIVYAPPARFAGTSAFVKGFRMPASHCARGCTEAGVRKASKEETAGGVCAGGSVGLWGFKVRFCATWPLWDGTAGLNG